jgi:hypothetical protein
MKRKETALEEVWKSVLFTGRSTCEDRPKKRHGDIESRVSNGDTTSSSSK